MTNPQWETRNQIVIIALSITFSWIPVMIILKIIQTCQEWRRKRVRSRQAAEMPQANPQPVPMLQSQQEKASRDIKGKGVDRIPHDQTRATHLSRRRDKGKRKAMPSSHEYSTMMQVAHSTFYGGNGEGSSTIRQPGPSDQRKDEPAGSKEIEETSNEGDGAVGFLGEENIKENDVTEEQDVTLDTEEKGKEGC